MQVIFCYNKFSRINIITNLPKVKLYSLKNQAAFNSVNKSGIKYNDKSFILVYSEVNLNSNLSKKTPIVSDNNYFIGVKINRKFANAVKRNKLKRQLKSIIQQINIKVEVCKTIIFIPRHNLKNITFHEFKLSIEKAISFCVKNYKPPAIK